MTAPELSAAELAVVARFDNAPAAPESWTLQRITPGRDLGSHVDRFGNVQVQVEIGSPPSWVAAANRTPAGVARFLRELADDIEATS